MTLRFGVHIDNREPLLRRDYTIVRMVDLAVVAEEAGFDSVWVGDSLLSKPRVEPLVTLAAMSQRTKRVRLGTSCLLTVARHPVWLALEWASLDHLSGGRTILGACIGSAGPAVRREIEVAGIPFKERASFFEEGLKILRELWDQGVTSFKGRHYNFDSVQFFTGEEWAPFRPLQDPVPIWIVANPFLLHPKEPAKRVMAKAANRIVSLGDGWMSCCRSLHPEEIEIGIEVLEAEAARASRCRDDFTVSYQVVVSIDPDIHRAQRRMEDYIRRYYPELGSKVPIGEWGPAGDIDLVGAWFEQFQRAGVEHFICRFAGGEPEPQIEAMTELISSLRESGGRNLEQNR